MFVGLRERSARSNPGIIGTQKGMTARHEIVLGVARTAADLQVRLVTELILQV